MLSPSEDADRAILLQWFLYLHRQRHCCDKLHEFLEIIEQHMLVAKPESRWSIQDVLESLNKILHHDRDRQRTDITKYRNMDSPADQYPPFWDSEEHQSRCSKHRSTQTSTNSDLKSTACPSRSASSNGTDDITGVVISQAHQSDGFCHSMKRGITETEGRRCSPPESGMIHLNGAQKRKAAGGLEVPRPNTGKRRISADIEKMSRSHTA